MVKILPLITDIKGYSRTPSVSFHFAKQLFKENMAMTISASDKKKTIKELEDKILELEYRLKSMPELIESNMLDAQMKVLFNMDEIIDNTWKKWKDNIDNANSSNILVAGFTELREELGKYSQEYLQWPEVKPETREHLEVHKQDEVQDFQKTDEPQNPEESYSLPDGVKIENVGGKLTIEIDPKISKDLLVQYRFEGKNIDPLSTVIIRELCAFAIIDNVPTHTVNRRVKLEEIFDSRAFKEQLNYLLGEYPKVGVNEKNRVLDIVSSHLSNKFPEIRKTNQGVQNTPL